MWGWASTAGSPIGSAIFFSIGGAIGIDYAGDNGGGAFSFLLEPLVKLNLGKQLGLANNKVNPFVLLGFALGIENGGAGNGNGAGGGNTDFALLFEFAGGVEYHITPSWAIMGFIPLYLEVGVGTPTVVTFHAGLH